MNRWFFWVLAPVMVGTAIGLPFWTKPPTVMGHVVLYTVCLTLLLATVGLADPLRFRWALQGVAVAVLVAYSAYLLVELRHWWHGEPFGLGSPRGRTNLFNAVGGFLVFGVPSITFLFRARTGRAVDELLTQSAGDAMERTPSDGDHLQE